VSLANELKGQAQLLATRRRLLDRGADMSLSRWERLEAALYAVAIRQEMTSGKKPR
jgi:hypothetical protein